MKKLFLIVLTCAAAVVFSACQSSETAQTDNAQVVDQAAQNAAAEEAAKMRSTRGMIRESSPNAASAPYDLQFLDTMIAHHQSALDMAKPIVAKTENRELKAFASKIVADQTKEITQMKAWRTKWYGENPPAINIEIPGMGDSMRGMNMRKMEAPGGKLLDLRFLDMMTPHHQGAITMSKEALDKAEHPEIKTLANQVIKAQEAEIKQMQTWKTAWTK